MTQHPDDIDWFQTTWEGNLLLTLQHAARMTFREKLEWLESAQELSGQFRDHRASQLRLAFEQWPAEYQ